MRATGYRCPHCPQVSSRRWNMKIHIQRRHNGELSSGLLYPPSAQIYPEQSQREKDSSSGIIDDIREMYETMRKIAEIKNMSTQFQSSSSFPLDQLPYVMPAFTMQQLPQINPELNNIVSFSLLNNLSRSNKNIGLRGCICNNCFQCWVDPIYSNSEDLISLIKSTKPFIHKCNTKTTDLQINSQDIQPKKNKAENALIQGVLALIIALWSYFPQNKIHLKAEELIIRPAYSSSESNAALIQDKDYCPQQHENDIEVKKNQDVHRSFGIQIEELNCNSVDVDLKSAEKSHWAYRAIAELQSNGKSSIEMDHHELVDFVKVVRGSYGMLTVHTDRSIRQIFMYLSFGDN